jgi:Tat protein secretion system quality control protein TatD with DNase activity
MCAFLLFFLVFMNSTYNLNRFTGGVAHSFTGSAEDCDRLLAFDSMFIGNMLFIIFIMHLHVFSPNN